MSSLLRYSSLRLLSFVFACGTLSMHAACESTSTPTAPSGMLQVVASASILRTGDTATVTVTATGTTPPAIIWTSSDASVAAVSSTGVVTARRPGTATVTASAGTAAGQVTLRVVPDFAGTWSGSLLRAQPTCAPTSTAAVCVPTTSQSVLLAAVTLTLTQAGATITGTLIDGLEPQSIVALAGTVGAGDVLALDGVSPLPLLPAAQRRLTVSTLRATYDPTVGTLSGSYTMRVERVGAAGTLEFDYTVQPQFRDFPRR